VASLDLDTVVDTAIALADDHGLEAVTLRRIARRLEVTPMALYSKAWQTVSMPT
jgi:hypothetical protein